MSHAFILRFLEDCTPVDLNLPGEDMMTKTGKPREGDIRDSPMAIPSALFFGTPSAGTATATKINKEGVDNDNHGQVFPIVALAAGAHFEMATHSTTFVRAEASDKDPENGLLQGHLKCF